MKVPLLDLKKQYKTIKKEIIKATEEIYESQQFILGPAVTGFEKEIADYCTTKYSIGVSSGSDALLISLMGTGIQKDDIVITTTYTFFATLGAIVRLGAVPLLVDIEPDTFNISAKSIKERLNALEDNKLEKIKAIIPVHLYGQCANMDAICEIADKYKLLVIEDAAQAIGAKYKNRQAGSIGDIGCFSFFPSKNLGGFGDGGMVVTNSKEIFEKIFILRNHGANPKYFHSMIGGNFRLDALQAKILSIKLKYLDNWQAKRVKNAEIYRKLFSDYQLDKLVKLPSQTKDFSVYNQFVIMVPNQRDQLRESLTKAEIGTEVYYPVPLHLQECFSYLGYSQGDFPVSEKASTHSLALPIYPELSISQQEYVVRKIKEFYK